MNDVEELVGSCKDAELSTNGLAPEWMTDDKVRTDKFLDT